MDEPRIDGIARLLASGVGRRRLVAGLGVALFGGLTRPQPARAGCKKTGRRCDKNNDCCDHAECKRDECACKNGFKECGGACVDLERDEKHCGRCDKKCRGGETCRRGRCDPGNDNNSSPCQPNCAGKACGGDGCGGSCGACGPRQDCDAGACRCPDGQRDLGGRCVDFCGTPSESPDPDTGCFCASSTNGPTVLIDPADVAVMCSRGRCQTFADCGDDEVCILFGCGGVGGSYCAGLCPGPVG